jgi:hypothetical protein
MTLNRRIFVLVFRVSMLAAPLAYTGCAVEDRDHDHGAMHDNDAVHDHDHDEHQEHEEHENH